jgi:hypothetical protein
LIIRNLSKKEQKIDLTFTSYSEIKAFNLGENYAFEFTKKSSTIKSKSNSGAEYESDW